MVHVVEQVLALEVGQYPHRAVFAPLAAFTQTPGPGAGTELRP